MKLEIITPEKKMFEGEVDAVRFPGIDGSFQVLNGHAPIISALTEGKIKVDLSSGDTDYDEFSGSFESDSANSRVIRLSIKGGVMEMQNNKIIVLAD
ncbi:MAG TPA: F0F1 ATP synthase subunit epsilon [Brumimicrobium sp.]|nr:F0F1 ATP synthase subunit epsilon [Brumimicrobium sp.]